jgi:hypothetical protein
VSCNFINVCLLTFQRIDLQDRLHCLQRNPTEEDLKQIEQLRISLNAEFTVLDALQRSVPDISSGFRLMLEEEDASAFDYLDDEELEDDVVLKNHPPALVGDVVPVESCTLPMPSTCDFPHPPHHALELTLRARQAHRHLEALQGAIADKSFQYSHVIPVAPRKSVRTRAHSAITKLNNVISFHC